MLKVKNVGNDEFVGRYRQQWIRIPPGAEIVVEVGAVHAWLGNPTSRNTPAWRQREEEFNRIKFMWCGELMDTPGAWESMKPKLVVSTLDDRPYVTVADDPDGTNTAPTDISPDIEREQIIATLKAMQERLKQLESASVPVDEKNVPPEKTDRPKTAPIDVPKSVKVS